MLDQLASYSGLFDYSSRCKLPDLALDLAELGECPIPAQIDFVAEPTIGALVGILYTIEGSARGGSSLRKSSELTKVPSGRYGFFSGYGSLSNQRWEEFLTFADANCPRVEFEIAAGTAVSLFNAIKLHLDKANFRTKATNPVTAF